VQGAGHADTGEGLVLGILLTDGHQTGHFLFSDLNFFAAEFGEGEVLDLEVAGLGAAGFGGFRGEGGGAHGGFSWGAV